MQFFLSLYPDSKELYLRSEHLVRRPECFRLAALVLKPGESRGRYAYDDLVPLGDGWHELDENALDEAGRAAV